jgi:hypothetical protein
MVRGAPPIRRAPFADRQIMINKYHKIIAEPGAKRIKASTADRNANVVLRKKSRQF